MHFQWIQIPQLVPKVTCIILSMKGGYPQCIEKGREEENFVYSLHAYFLTHQAFLLHGWPLVLVIVLIKHISTILEGKTVNIFWRKFILFDALWFRGLDFSGCKEKVFPPRILTWKWQSFFSIPLISWLFFEFFYISGSMQLFSG